MAKESQPICTIDGCDRPAIAKGLCATHYMRQRRHGSASTVKRRGPAPQQRKAAVRDEMSGIGWSARTFDRFWGAIRRLETAGWHGDALTEAVKNATRPNGSMNIAELERVAAYVVGDEIEAKTRWKRSRIPR